MGKQFQFDHQALNAILLPILDANDIILWLSASDFTAHHYLNSAYEKLWGRPPEHHLEYKVPWINTIKAKEQKRILQALDYRVSQKDSSHVMVYQVQRTDNKTVFIKDVCFSLYDNQNQKINAGTACAINETEYEEALITSPDQEFTELQLYKDLSKIFMDEFCLDTNRKREDKLNDIQNWSSTKKISTEYGMMAISKREMQCLFYLFHGYTAKATGEFLFISSRTVEAHLNSIRNKLNLRNKLELFHLIQSSVFTDII